MWTHRQVRLLLLSVRYDDPYRVVIPRGPVRCQSYCGNRETRVPGYPCQPLRDSTLLEILTIFYFR